MEVKNSPLHKLVPWWLKPVSALMLSGCATAMTPPGLESTPRTVPNPASASAAQAARDKTEDGGNEVTRALGDKPRESVRKAFDDQRKPAGQPAIPRKSASTKNPKRSTAGTIQLASLETEALDDPIGSEREGSRSTLSERLKIPQTLPGADAPPLVLPPYDADRPNQRAVAIEDLFPGLSRVSSDMHADVEPGQPALTLNDLEQTALANNPTIAQAIGDIEAAMGAAVQAGAYPNPEVGYEADTVGSGGTRNYQGLFFTQEIVTADKLDLARSIANVDFMNKQLALRKARADLLRLVRSNYYAVLVARENLRYSEALAQFTNEVYRVQVEQLKGGQAAAYEPMQLRALAVQSRGAFAQARNRYASAWKQLAASLGDPNMAAVPLEGEGARVGLPVDYETSLDYMLSNHTDILQARNLEFQARLGVRLAEVTPIPNVKVYSAVQKDFTTPPVTRTTYNLQIGVPVPIFNQNRGGIQKSRGDLVRAAEELGRVRVTLSAQLADAFERYENNRILMAYYRDQILPDQARVYRGVYERHQQESDQVGFGDVIVAQQNLLASIGNLIIAMNGQWTAYSDIATLLQLEDLNQMPYAAPSEIPLAPLDPETELPPP